MQKRSENRKLTAATAFVGLLAGTASPGWAAAVWWDRTAAASDTTDAAGATVAAGSGVNVWGGANGDSFWSASDAPGDSLSAYPTGADVYFSAGTATTPNASITVGGNIAANSVTFEDATTTLSIVSPTVLTIANGVTIRSGAKATVNRGITLSGGITMDSGAVASNLGAINLSGNQTVANNSANLLTLDGGSAINGVVSFTAGSVTLGSGSTSIGGTGTVRVDGAKLNYQTSSGGSSTAFAGFTFVSGSFGAADPKGNFSNKPVSLQGDFAIEGGRGFTWAGAWTINGDRRLVQNSGSGTNFNTMTFNGALIGTAVNQTLTIETKTQKVAAVNFTAGANNPRIVLDGVGTYTLSSATANSAGGMQLKGGTFNVGASSTITANAISGGPAGVGTLSLAGGTVAATTAAQTLRNAVTLDGNVAFNGALGLTFDTVTGLATPTSITITGNRTLTSNLTGGAVATFVGGIGEDAAGRTLTKGGPGLLQLGNDEAIANTYTGLTTVTGGELGLKKAVGTDAIAGNVAVNAGGTLALLAAGQVNDASDLSLTGTLKLNGFTETIDTLAWFTGGVLDTGSSLGVLTVSTLTLNGGTPVGPGAYTGADYAWITGGGTLAVVPEPASLAVLGLGAAAALGRRRRRC